MTKLIVLLTCAMITTSIAGIVYADAESSDNPGSKKFQCKTDAGKKSDLAWPENFGLTADVVGLDSKQSGAAAASSNMQLGLKYDLSGVLFGGSKCKSTLGPGGIIVPNAIKDGYDDLSGSYVKFAGKGTLTNNADANPESLLEFNLDGGFAYDVERTNFKLALTSKYEASQNGDNSQTVFGGSMSLDHIFGQSLNHFMLFMTVGQVDVKDDAQRKATDPNDTSYNRADAEVVLLQTVNHARIRDIQISYRYFKEISPSTLIQDANLDSSHYATYRIGLMSGFYVAYSTGHLPFDQDKDGVAKVGFQTDIDLNFWK